jgi:AGZA family xanthine/uracil permease-like MFS transporter
MADNATAAPFKYEWFTMGDINGFFSLMFDNVTVLSFLAGILIFGFGFPAEVVYKKMFPGTAFGVLFGDLVYTWMAFRLAKKTGNPKVTAMPLGLDTPSTIGIALAVLGPSFLAFKAKGYSEMDAAMMTWYLGMATMVLTGIFKFVFSFFGGWLQKIIPQAGLLGSLGGIGLALIAFGPVLEIFGMPIVGLMAFGLIIYTLIAGIKLPKNLPGVLTAVVAGTALYYLIAPFGWAGGQYHGFSSQLYFVLPIPTLDFIKGMSEAIKYLPVAIPFAILTVIGGINVTESARVAGDDFNTRDILLTEAIATLIAGVCGGVAQSTPYIGQPAYKAMGSRAGYTLLAGIFIGLGGLLGYVGFIVELIPRAVIAPILVFVGLDIMCQAFHACPKRHAPAVALAFFPTVVRMLQIKLSNIDMVPSQVFASQLVKFGNDGRALPDLQVVIALGNGFIVTGMLWGAFMAKLIDRQVRAAAFYLGVCALLTFFGIIHSAIPDGNMYLPWTLGEVARQIPYQFTAGYLALAALLLALSFSKEVHEGHAPEHY